MFRVRNNTDLFMKTMQIKYGGMTKPMTPIESKYVAATVAAPNYVNQLQQRYRDSYYESGMDPDALGCESYSDWLKRGPFYHYAFARDKNNNASTCTVTTTYEPATELSTNAYIYVVAHKSVTCQMVFENGVIKSVTKADI